VAELRYLPLFSSLHDPEELHSATAPFLAELSARTGLDPVAVPPDAPELPSVVYVQTGGTEAAFRRLSPRLPSPLILLSHPAHNSLPASLEILTWIKARNRRAVIVHGEADEAASLLERLIQALSAGRSLKDSRLGLFGAPSDWLIASRPPAADIEKRWGCRVIEIPLEEIRLPPGPCPGSAARPPAPTSVEQARQLGPVLSELVRKHGLDGLSLRCFDLLKSWGNTGCLALSQLNDSGIPASCEGDLPALFTLRVVKALTGLPGFMANPSSWSPSRQELILAHCSVPLTLLTDHVLDTHFESGIGVGIRGKFRKGPCSLFKFGGRDLSRLFYCRGEITANLSRDDLCRTQIVFKPTDDFSSYLAQPLGNHLIVVPGWWEGKVEAFRRLFL